MAGMPDVSVIIPARNGASTIAACLEAVLSSDFPDFEVIVSDDASDDATPGIASRFACRIVRSEVPRGAASARNAGAAASAGRILFFIDSDILIPPGCLRRISAALTTGECDAVVGLLDKEAAYANLSSFYKNAYMHYTYSLLPPEMDVFYTSVAAVGREAFFDVGGFDEDYRSATIEDTEVGGRMRAHGYRIRLDKGLAVRHLRHYTLRELLATGFRRTSGIVKIMLRRGFGRGGERTSLTSPRTFTAGIALSLAACALLLLAPFGGLTLIVGAFSAFILSLFLNRGFLLFILREKGAATAAAAAPLMIVDQIAHGLGAVHGLLTYAAGRRY